MQTNILPKENIIFRKQGAYNRLQSTDPASQYLKQQLIFGSKYRDSSFYDMNLAALTAYTPPSQTEQIVTQNDTPYYVPPNTYWNQQSDRPFPANQKAVTASGSTYHSSSTKHSIMRMRPGAMSPGGKGVDIKHNSYNRYLNKLKGSAPLRQGPIPPNFGLPIPFNRAYPIYGGKTFKVGLIAQCNCSKNGITEKQIYGNPLSSIQDQILSVTYHFSVGDYVWAKKNIATDTFYKAQIKEITNNTFVVEFTDDNTIQVVSSNDVFIYTDCNCNYEEPVIDQILDGKYTQELFETSKLCVLTNTAVNTPYL